MRCIYQLLIYLFYSHFIIANDTIFIHQPADVVLRTNTLTGVSEMSIHDHLLYRQNQEGVIDSVYINKEIYEKAAPLNTTLYRFPGGTLANYYHFYGNGYGIDTNEVRCISGKINNPWAAQFIPYDNVMNKNAMYYFAQEMIRQKESGKKIQTLLVLNTHTHIYQGDLKPYSAKIQQLLSDYTGNNILLLNSNGDWALDSTNIDWYARELYKIQGTEIMLQIKQQLLQDSGFLYRLGENLAGIRYLAERGIPVVGIELGNETYDEYVLFDDQLTYLGGDCTTDDLTVPPPYSLPLKYYFEGLLKNRLITSIYADTLRKIYGNIPIGIPAANWLNYFLPDSNSGQPIFIKRYELYGKKRDLWNNYFSLQPDISALIPHIYFQELLPCKDYNDFEEKRWVEEFAKKAIRAFCDSSILYNLNSIPAAKYNKSLWVTEWNFTDASFASNTFLHAQYIYEFLRQIVDIQEQFPNLVHGWIYHLLAGGYYPWPLIRTERTSPETQIVEKQILYHPFYIWSSTLSNPVYRLTTPDLLTDSNIRIDIFAHSTHNEMYVHFINMDTTPAMIPLTNYPIYLGQTAAYIINTTSYILHGESLTATPYTSCNSLLLNGYDNNYQIVEEQHSRLDTLWIPALSMGKYTLQWDTTQTTTALPKKGKVPAFNIFPNPASDIITIQITSAMLSNSTIYTIYDMTGRIVQTGHLHYIENSIDTRNIPAGNYLINTQNNAQIFDYQKITLY